MIVFLLNGYIFILVVLIWLKIVPSNLFWKLSPILVMLVLLVGLFIPMGWGAPTGPVLAGRQSVRIVPDVAGEVIEVPVQPNTPLKAGDVLFRIDPAPYESALRALQAQLTLAKMRVEQIADLQRKDAASLFNLQQRQAERDQLQAQVDAAQWNLDKTTVRAPADGYVTNVTLRKGARVGTLSISPVMSFIDTSDVVMIMQVAQIDARYVEVGQKVEATFKYLPGRVFPGKVETILPAISSGQAGPSGTAVTPEAIQALPFVIRVRLDDASVAERLPVGSTGTAAVFTSHVQVSHIIRRVVLRQQALLNYVLPF